VVNARKSRAEAAAVKVAAMRAEQARADRRRKLIAWGGVALVLVLVAALVVAKLAGVGTAKAVKTTAATTSLTSTLASAATGLESLGAGTAANPPTAIKATALTSAGKPRIMYVGAEYCPFCAAQRWAVAVALSRFGTWSGLGQTTSAAGDVYPNTPTLSFHGAQLTSSYVTFTGVETTTNQPLTGGGYQPLDTLSAADTALVKKYNAAPYVAASSAGSIPFIDIGGAYISSGASYTPQLLSGKTQAQVAAALKVPTDPIAQAVGGAANLLTAAICKTTNNQPAAVCTASGVTAAATKLGHGS
jgi:Domain of unknown function (DUF929)